LGEKLHDLLPFLSQIIFFWCNLAAESEKKKSTAKELPREGSLPPHTRAMEI